MTDFEKYLLQCGIPYPPEQLRYFRSLLRQREALASVEAAFIRLSDPNISCFPKLSGGERELFVVEFDAARSESDKGKQRRFRAAILEMNAGLGTGLGMAASSNESKASAVRFQATDQKGSEQELSILQGKFHWYLRHVHEFQSLSLLPWNSEATRESWEREIASFSDAFREKGIRLYDHQIQYSFPRLISTTTEPFTDAPPPLCLAPGGHGQTLFELYGSGMLQQLVEDGVEILLLVNSDNINATCSPAWGRYLLEHEIPVAMVTTDRTRADAKGGILALRERRLIIIERAQVAPDEQALFEAIGLNDDAPSQPFNTNTIYVNVRLFEKYLHEIEKREGQEGVFCALTPHLIINRKEIAEEGKIESVDQLEGAIGSVVLRIPDAKLFHYPRHQRLQCFAPIKTEADVEHFYRSGKYRFDVESAALVEA